MIKKILVGASICLTLAACSEESKTENKTVPLTAQDVTNTSVCSGRKPVNTSLYSNRWAAKFRYNNGAKVTQVLDFNYGRLTITAYQEFKGKRDEISVASRISDNNQDTFRVQDTDSASNTITAGGESFYYALSVSTNKLLRYSFEGPCLVFTASDGKTVFVPSTL
jgi:hypothetical protein